MQLLKIAKQLHEYKINFIPTLKRALAEFKNELMKQLGVKHIFTSQN